MPKKFDPNATLYNVEVKLPNMKEEKWVVLFDSLDKTDAESMKQFSLRSRNTDSVRVVPRFYQG